MEMLRDSDSSERHIDATERHQRRCRQTPGAEAYGARIEPVVQALRTTSDALRRARREETFALDDLVFADRKLDIEVSGVHGVAVEWDKKNPTALVLVSLFPTGKFTPITDAPKTEEPTLVEDLLRRMDGLSPDSPLRPRIELLRTASTASQRAAGIWGEAVKARVRAHADDEMAQATLRRGYEANYLNARESLGREAAELLFLPISHREPAAPRPPRGGVEPKHE